MNRREILKGLMALPIAGVLGCDHPTSTPPPEPPKNTNVKIHTLQVLFEGAFAIVLEKNNPNKITAFVPRPLPNAENSRELGHEFFFNDPAQARRALEKDRAGYHFQLADDGLRNNPEPYVNPGFADMTAETDNWRLPDRLVTVELPFPDSMNFSGRPLHVTFESGRTGVMPTNHILEYYVEDSDKVKMVCSQMDGKCASSPNCPPGVLRFFFGVAPQNKEGGPKHAVDFFNFILRSSFPDLEKRFRLKSIEPSLQLRMEQEEKRGALSTRSEPKLIPAVANSQTQAHLRNASAILDCQLIGIVVRTNKPAVQG